MVRANQVILQWVKSKAPPCTPNTYAIPTTSEHFFAWGLAFCRPVKVKWRLEGICCLHLQGGRTSQARNLYVASIKDFQTSQHYHIHLQHSEIMATTDIWRTINLYCTFLFLFGALYRIMFVWAKVKTGSEPLSRQIWYRVSGENWNHGQTYAG
jgi:hypothetical protein